MPDQRHLLEQAYRCFRLARHSTDSTVARRLEALGNEFLDRAHQAEGPRHQADEARVPIPKRSHQGSNDDHSPT